MNDSTRKIVLFATTDLNTDQRLQRICSALVGEQIKVLLVGRKLKQSKALLKQNFQQKRWQCFFNKGILFYIEFNLRIFFFLRFKKFDIVTANDLDTVLGVYLGTLFSKTQRYFDAHEYFTEVPELQGKKIKKKLWQKVEKLVVYFHKHYTVNKSLQQIFEEQLGVKFGVIQNVPQLKKENQTINKKSKFILYQGALNKGRGLEQMIQAMVSIDMPLHIAGAGDIEQELKQLVEKLNLQEKVIFLGKLLPQELQKITPTAYIGINLLENNSLNYYYSLANKFFDYLHAEIPQICMDFPEYRNIQNEKEIGVLVKDLKAETLQSAIKKISNEIDYQKMKTNCKTLKAKYNWQNEVQKLHYIYSIKRNKSKKVFSVKK